MCTRELSERSRRVLGYFDESIMSARAFMFPYIPSDLYKSSTNEN